MLLTGRSNATRPQDIPSHVPHQNGALRNLGESGYTVRDRREGVRGGGGKVGRGGGRGCGEIRGRGKKVGKRVEGLVGNGWV